MSKKLPIQKELPASVKALLAPSRYDKWLRIYNEVIKQIQENKVVRDRYGNVLIHKSAVESGMNPTRVLLRMYREALDLLNEKHFGWEFKSKLGSRVSGMRLGPKAANMTADELRVPAVYEVVCEKNGRIYVGSSKRPDLRRACHMFWLRNIGKEGTSNIFGRNPAISLDVEKYGVDAFYFEIVQSMPQSTEDERLNAESDYMEKEDKRLYNMKMQHKKMHRYVTRTENPAFILLTQRKDKLKKAYAELAAKPNKTEAQKTKLGQMRQKLRLLTVERRNTPKFINKIYDNVNKKYVDNFKTAAKVRNRFKNLV